MDDNVGTRLSQKNETTILIERKNYLECLDNLDFRDMVLARYSEAPKIDSDGVPLRIFRPRNRKLYIRSYPECRIAAYNVQYSALFYQSRISCLYQVLT